MKPAMAALALSALAWGAGAGPVSAARPDACPAVVDTLDRLAQMMPSLAGNANALVATMLLPVSNSAHRANAEAASAGWTAETLDALIEIATTVRLVVQRELPVGAETAAHMEALATPVVAEAEAICGGYSIPRPVVAG